MPPARFHRSSTIFLTVAHGADAAAAFAAARAAAPRQLRHAWVGRSGTIAEKHSFVMSRDSAAEVLQRAARLQAAADGTWDAERLAHVVAQLRERPESGRLIAEALLLLDDERIADPDGPAGCIPLDGDAYIFFGRVRW
jgi:hypothetical protein